MKNFKNINLRLGTLGRPESTRLYHSNRGPVIPKSGKATLNPADRIAREKQDLSYWLNTAQENLFFLRQESSDGIWVHPRLRKSIALTGDIIPATRPGPGSPGNFEDSLPGTVGAADAMVAPMETGTALVIRAADCLPLFVWLPEAGLMAAVHLGWRGCHQNLLGRTLSLLRELSGFGESRPAPLLKAWLGPHRIGEAYEVGPEFADYFSPGKPTISEEPILRSHPQKADKNLFSMAAHSRKVLANWPGPRIIYQSGENITSDYTQNSPGRKFYSHRAGDQGRNLSYVFCF